MASGWLSLDTHLIIIDNNSLVYQNQQLLSLGTLLCSPYIACDVAALGPWTTVTSGQMTWCELIRRIPPPPDPET